MIQQTTARGRLSAFIAANVAFAIAHPASEKKGLLDALSDDTDSLFPNPSKLLDQAPGFYFMWK